MLLGKQDGDNGKLGTIRDELSISPKGIILKGNQVVIPRSLIKSIKIAHAGHQGMTRTKQLGRCHFWFPDLDTIVEDEINRCHECQVNTDRTKQEPLEMSELPSEPWKELSAPNRKHILVLIDDYSRYPIVKTTTSTSAKARISILNEIFALFGVPTKIRTDNGPPCNSTEFRSFVNASGIQHK